jgi:hypothetical protein
MFRLKDHDTAPIFLHVPIGLWVRHQRVSYQLDFARLTVEEYSVAFSNFLTGHVGKCHHWILLIQTSSSSTLSLAEEFAYRTLGMGHAEEVVC